MCTPLLTARAPHTPQAQADSRVVVAAFVTFREEAGKAACLRAQPHSRMRQWWALKPQHKLRGRCVRSSCFVIVECCAGTAACASGGCSSRNTSCGACAVQNDMSI